MSSNDNNSNKQPLEFLSCTYGGLTMEDSVGPVNALKVAAVPQNLARSAEASTATPTINKLDYVGISLVERRSRDVKPQEKNDSLGISGINQPDVTTGNQPDIDCITDVNRTPYYVDKSDNETIGFLLDCAKRGNNRDQQPPPSICKVSRILRDHSVRSFIPQLVSIGPIHRENKKLKEFEWLKECYLDDLLNRCHDSTLKITLEAFLLKVNTLIPHIRESYAGMKKKYSNSELARMMVMDGCFILEFCFKHEDEENVYLPNKMQNTRIAMDLMLLENQVPFFVLQALFDCSMGEVRFTLSNVLNKYLAPYSKLFRSQLREKIPTTDVDSDSTHDHVLGYLHKRYQLVAAKSSKPKHAEASKLLDEEQAANSSNPIQVDAETSMLVDEELAAKSSNPADAEELKLVDEEGMEDTTFHSIVELDRSGVNFKPHKEDEWSMTIKFQSSLSACLPWFWIKPTLLMPTLVIDDTTELILRNFIAYEQSFPHNCYYFTSYAHAMDMLIDTQEDIAKLVESKVLVNILGSNQEAADMINKICKNMYVTDFCYTEEFKQMDKHYNRFWPKHIAWLRRIYFSNPWSTIALVAAIILFGLTVVQTIFTIRAA